MNIYMNAQFTGLHQKTTLISLALVSDDGDTFYAEFTDYDRTQINNWLKENVLFNTRWISGAEFKPKQSCFIKRGKASKGSRVIIGTTECYGNTEFVAKKLTNWLKQFEEITIVSDCLAYGWVLFCELFGGARSIPENVFYMPVDICDMFIRRSIDPDINRIEFAFGKEYSHIRKHYALFDANVIKMCYDKLRSV